MGWEKTGLAVQANGHDLTWAWTRGCPKCCSWEPGRNLMHLGSQARALPACVSYLLAVAHPLRFQFACSLSVHDDLFSQGQRPSE